MNSKDLRQKFIEFFEQKGHKILPPAKLIPENDPSVLFTTAGMQQFKKYYTNPSEAPSPNVVTIQPCFRTSDISEVGDDTHLTFFEMMGNFSFGSYFKKEAIGYAWDFLTNELKIDKDRIHATYFDQEKAKSSIAITVDTDNESKKILENIPGLKKIEPQGDDNFWTLGLVGTPGGPTVEFYVDRVEVWNLVFNEMIYTDRFGNPVWESTESKGVDTGMGLERMLVVLNDFKNVYETDLFLPLIDVIKKELPLAIGKDNEQIRIVADHIKAAVFLVNDGVIPGNKKQNATLRKIIRRAVQNSGWKEDNLWIEPLIDQIIKIYTPAFTFKNISFIKKTIQDEVSKFNNILVYAETTLKDRPTEQFSINDAFLMSQSQGVPFELYNDYASIKKVKLDRDLFYQKLKQHQDLSRTASSGMFKGGLARGGEAEAKLHSATHLLLASLRQILGGEIHQKGSNITAERLRFDFSYPEKLPLKQIKAVEDLVNEKIQANLPIKMAEMSQVDAQNCGAIGEFDDKYGFKVKVYTMGDFSKEICGGPHAQNTGELGYFKIIKEESSSAGIRRIKAILE